ncbi:S9 family peptidase [bacterium]|nr:S9 family peptidase [bacterium]
MITWGLLWGSAFAQDTVVPNENLVVEGVPPISKSLVEEIGLYTESRGAAFLSWHPARREMLIQTRFGDVPQIHQVKMPGGARTQLTFFPERVASANWRPGRGDGFIFSKDIGGNEFFQLYWKAAGTGKVSLLTDGKSRNTGGIFSRSGGKLAYESTRRTGKDTDIYWMNPSDAGSEKLLLAVDGGGWSVTDIAPDEKGLLLHNYISANESQIWWLDPATGQKKQLSPVEKEKVSYSGATYTPDGRSILYTSDKDNEFSRLFKMDLASGKSEVISPKLNWDVSAFTLSDDGKVLAYVVNEAGVERLAVCQFPSGKPIKLAAIPEGTVGGLSFHSNNRDLAFTLSSAQSSSDAFSVDVKTGKLTRWTESETGGLDPTAFSKPQSIKWKSFDGREIYGFLYLPPAKFSGPRPVILNIHGGPESQFQPGYLGRNNYLLNELGVAIIFPNVRGSAGFGKTYLAADNWEKREDSVKDIGALLDWIGTQPNLDASRVMVMGGSYGGYMTLASMTHFNDRLRGGLDVVGISNFVTFLEKTEGYRRDLRRVEYGDERDPKMREILQAISPTNNVQKISKPMFIVQGKNDPRVPLNEAEQMVAALRKKGGTCWYLMAKDEGHGFGKKKNADFQFYATVRFIQEVLLK